MKYRYKNGGIVKLQNAWTAIPSINKRGDRDWLNWWLSNRTEQLDKEGTWNNRIVGYDKFINPIQYKEQWQSELPKSDDLSTHFRSSFSNGNAIFGITDRNNHRIVWGDNINYWTAQLGQNPYGNLADFQMPFGVRIPETVKIHEYTHERFPENHGYIKQNFKLWTNDPYLDSEDEIRSRLMQLRFDNNFNPSHKFDINEILKLKQDPHIKDHKILNRYPVEFIQHLLNDVADNSESIDITDLARSGGIIKGQNGFLNTWQKAYNSKFGKGLRDFMFGKDRDLTDEEYFEKYGYNKPVGGIGILGALVAPEWEGLEIPEITAQHIGNQGKVLRWFESGNSKMLKVPVKETSKKVSNWQRFLKLSQQEQDDFVRRWNGESFQGFSTLKGDKQSLSKFRSWINSRK